MPRERPPFRADHVGSLLRPPELLAARAKRQAGELDAEALRAIEDEHIVEAVRRQQDVGLRSATDGEFRRRFFHTDFLERLGGVEVRGGIEARFKGKLGEVAFAPPVLAVTGKLRHLEPIQLADFEFLAAAAGPAQTPKVCIPSPTMVHFRGGRQAIDLDAYPELDAFFDDLAACYRAELRALYEAGCRYVQLDDTNLAYLCDPKLRAGAAARGDDPDRLPRTYAELINAALDGRPEDLAVSVHLCRGNFRSAWVAEGGYEPVADVLFNALEVDGFFLEYDDARSGDFAPLRFVPKGKSVVLGLVTTKVGQLERAKDLIRRVEAAARHVPLDQLCLSPQCGFSSSSEGNQLSRDAQWAKLELVVEVAREVWGQD